MTCRNHKHPRVNQPMSHDEFIDEFVSLAARAGINEECAIDFSDVLARRHQQDERSYADVDVNTLQFRFAPAILELPPPHVRGLIAHEIGHVLCRDMPGGGTEEDADEAARRVFGMTIKYDCRWPGKGLQRANPHKGRPNPTPFIHFYNDLDSGYVSEEWEAFANSGTSASDYCSQTEVVIPTRAIARKILDEARAQGEDLLAQIIGEALRSDERERTNRRRHREDERSNPDDITPERFAEWVLDRARTAPEELRFGPRKVFLGPIFEDSGITRQEFQDLLFEARRKGLLSLARADLVSAMDPALVASSHFSDGIGDVNFVIDASYKEPWERNPAVDVCDPAVHKAQAALPEAAFRLTMKKVKWQPEPGFLQGDCPVCHTTVSHDDRF